MLADDKTMDDEETHLNTKVEPHIHVINGSLDEDPTSPQGMVITGKIHPNTLRFLRVDNSYQRPLGNRADIWQALKNGTVVPAIEIGVRGQDFTTKGDDFIIKDPAYIIDGWQRVGTALSILESVPDHNIRLFAVIHFGTDSLWERHRFTDLNRNVRRVSTNLHLRNMRDNNDAVLTLYGLCHNTKDFPLYKRVSWSQNMHRGDLVTAAILVNAVWNLHRHLAYGKSGIEGVARGLLVQSQKVRLAQFRANVREFFSIVDGCWGIANVEYRKASPHLRGAFLNSLATVFSQHLDFWDATGTALSVNADIKRKLSSFPVHDPNVIHLCSSGGGSPKPLLMQLIISHLNKGRRSHHLTPRKDDQ